MADPADRFAAERTAQLQRKIRLLSDTEGEILRLMQQALDRIQTLLAGQPSAAEQWMLPQLQAQVRQAMQEFTAGGGAALSSALGDAWGAGLDLIDAPLAAAGLARGMAPYLDNRQLLAMRAFTTDRIADVGAQAVNRINTQLGLTVLGAQTPSDAVGAIRDILGESSRSRALMITRTSLPQAYSSASYARLQQQAELVPALQKQWRASGKRHPRHNHHVADGQIQPVDKPFNLGGVKLMYPHDPKAPAKEVINCGCTLLPIIADWGDAMASPGRKYDADPTLPELLAART